MEKPPLGVQPFKKSETFQAKQQETKSKPCVYCEKSGHRPSDCSKVASVAERKKVLIEKQLCLTVLVPSTRLSTVAVKWVVYSANEDIILQFVTGDQQNTC